MYYEIQNYCIGNIVHDRKLTFNNKEYMINLHINWNIIYFNHLEINLHRKLSIIVATIFDNLMSVASLVEIHVKSFLYLRIFG